MKKLSLFFILFSLFLIPVSAQNWSPVGTGMSESVRALCVYNGNLYAGGTFTMAGGNPVNQIAQWNGTTWSAVGSGVTGGSYPEVISIAVYNGNLYAAGQFTTAGGNPSNNIAMWNGTSWAALGTGITGGSNPYISALTVYNGKLIAAGNFTHAGGTPANDIASWDGTTWTALSAGVSPTGGTVFSLCAYDSVLYAACNFDSAGGHKSKSIAQWNGTIWTIMGTGIANNGYPGYVNTLCVYHKKLYAGGTFDTAGGLPQNDFACWNGIAWDSTGIGSLNLNGVPWCSLVASNKLYLGGSMPFLTAGIHVHNITSWNGTLWDSVGSGFAGDTGVFALCIYNNQLYAGGIFTMSGNTSTTYIAKWNHPLGVNELQTATTNDTKLFPNPNKGVFTVTSEQPEAKNIIEIYNMLGKKVYRSDVIRNSKFVIDISSQPTGVYLYRVISETEVPISSGKLIIE